LLFDLEPADIQPPLAQFQATRANKKELSKLLKTLNTALAENALSETHIDEAIEVWWPKLEQQFKVLPSEHPKATPFRSDRELLEEILALARSQNRLSERQHRKKEDDGDPDALDPFTLAIWETIDSVDPDMYAMDDNEPNYYKIQTGDGRNYTIFVPADTPIEKIKDIVLPQVPVPPQSGKSSRHKKV
jgi:hypothetical protein